LPSITRVARLAEQGERHHGILRRPVWGPAGNVLNLPFQGWLLPFLQRVSECQTISITEGEISRDAS